MQSDYLGGVRALDWRKRVAASSEGRDGDHVRTFKFPLKIEEDLSCILPNAEKLYDILEGTDKGSLAALVFATHLSGFRLFGAAAETEAFEAKEQFRDREFVEIANKNFNKPKPPGNLCPSEIFITLKSNPRGENAAWDFDCILRKLHRHFGITNNEADECLLGVFTSATKTIHGKYTEWSHVRKNLQEALGIFSRAFQAIDADFPDFSMVTPQPIKPDNRIFAYDPGMTFHEMNIETSDYWAHRSISVIVQSLLNDGKQSGDKTIKTRFTTRSHNGFGWLFGNGLVWLQNTSTQEICDNLSIPESEINRVSQLQAFAKALPCRDPLWQTDGFGVFRKAVGGKFDSWISNYWSRLNGLQKYFGEQSEINIPSPSDSLEKEYNNLFSGNNLSADELRRAAKDTLPQEMNKAREAIQSLKGEAKYKETDIEKVQNATAYLGSLLGEIQILNNRIEQKKENEETSDAKQQWEQLKINIKNIKKPDRLNRIGGGATRVSEVTSEIEMSLAALLEVRRKHYDDLMKHAEKSGNTDPLPNLAAVERKKLEDKGRDPASAKENARRRLLHQFAILANRMSEKTREDLIKIIKPAFPEKNRVGRKNRDANKFFYNRQGAIYVSPFSTRRHEPLSLEKTGLEKDWLAEAESLLKSVMKNLSNSGTPDLLKDMLILEGYIFAMRLRCLPLSIPADLGKHALPMHKEEKIFIPPVLRAQFEHSSKVSRDAVLRLFNLYANAINGLLFQATRTGFVTRVVLSRVDTDKLIYVPKQNVEWIPPKPYFKGQSPVARALRKDWIVWKENGHVVNVENTFTKLCETKGAINTEEAAAYLSQSPHDWWLQLCIEGIGEERCGMTVSTSGKGSFANAGATHPCLVRLRGPSSRRTVLDRTLWMKTRGNDLKLGDPNLIMDTRYSQKVELKNGLPCIKVEPGTTTMEAAVALIDKAALDTTSPFDMYNHIVAIDQGERGIGYAVFDLREWIETGQPKPMIQNGRTVTGMVSVPSIRALIRAVRSHRGRRQPQQKANLRYSTLLQQRRENVVGDVCNRIDTLCEKYGGFPVLESTVGNFEAGGKQLELVYNSVSKMYLYDNSSEAQNAKRHHRWACAKKWQHPWLVKRKYNSGEGWLDQPDDLYNLYPGASVAPAGTSQVCHQCKRNPIQAIKDFQHSHFDVDEGGCIQLPNGQIKLCKGSEPPVGEENEKWEKRMGKEKKRLPLNRPMGAGKYKKDEMERQLRRNLRRPNPSFQSPDTTQSRYHCVYTDCNFAGHADVNAAINIGVKFLGERVHFGASKEKLEK